MALHLCNGAWRGSGPAQSALSPVSHPIPVLKSPRATMSWGQESTTAVRRLLYVFSLQKNASRTNSTREGFRELLRQVGLTHRDMGSPVTLVIL
jgi:hypothetical protein